MDSTTRQQDTKPNTHINFVFLFANSTVPELKPTQDGSSSSAASFEFRLEKKTKTKTKIKKTGWQKKK
jgi:hypothetical protein